jgi:transcription antitermination factor NusG
MKAWYAVHTKPNNEKRVAHILMMRGIHTFLPLLPETRGKAARALFPTYLFIECDLSLIDPARLNWIPGLRRMLTVEGHAAVVPDTAIALIREELDRIESAGGLPTHGFRPGDEVVIDQGPLAGLRGVFQGPLGPAERVHILLHFLGQTNRTEVPVEALRRAGEDGGAPTARRGTRGRGRHISYS